MCRYKSVSIPLLKAEKMAKESKDSNLVGIVTGGSRGIGKACVKLFASQSLKTVFCALHVDRNEAETVESETNASYPGSTLFLACDVTVEAEVKKLVEYAVAQYGKIDFLVNCAGWHPPPKTIDNFSSEEFVSLFNLNVLGTFMTCKYSLPHLRLTRGSIVNLSSVVASIGQKEGITYVATKGAIESMTKALAIDEAVHYVRVNCVAPGNVWTPLLASFVGATEDPQKTTQFLCDSQHIRRMASGNEIATAILFLLKDGTFCTGTVLMATGGAELGFGQKQE